MSRTVTLRSTKLALLAALPFSALALCALAQSSDPAAAKNPRPDFFQHMLKAMDTNGDGRISQDEFLAAATSRFKAIDTQNKGSISADDIAQSPAMVKRDERRAEFLVRHLDTAGNGYISQQEFLAAAQKRFAKLDQNGDGKLTPTELSAPRWPHARNGNAPAQDAGSSRRAQFVQKYFDKVDTNHDGVVTQDEYLAAATARYKKLDTQGNGQVTAAEIASTPRALNRDQHLAQHEVKRLDTNGDGTVSLSEYLAAAKTRFAKIDKNGDGFIDADEMTRRSWAGKGHGHSDG
jgi:Ca2+-binding EF-hand superfamily protein